MTFIATLTEKLTDLPDSLQAVIVAVGVAVIGTAASIYDKSKIAGITTAFLGLVLVVAPFTLPASKLFGPSIPQTVSGAGWHIYDRNGYASELLVAMDDSGSTHGTLTTKSCPVGPGCDATPYAISENYNKDTGALLLTRTNLNHTQTRYYAIFDLPYMAQGSIVESDGYASTFVIYRSY